MAHQLLVLFSLLQQYAGNHQNSKALLGSFNESNRIPVRSTEVSAQTASRDFGVESHHNFIAENLKRH